MSGGSYSYLCYDSLEDVARKHAGPLRDMMERLEELDPDAPVAVHTRAIFAQLEVLAAQVDALRGVWQAVEWRDSGDFGDYQMMDAIKEYNEAHAMDVEP